MPDWASPPTARPCAPLGSSAEGPVAFGCVPLLADRRAAWRKPSATERQDRGQAQRTRTGSADAVRIRTKTKSLVFSDWCKGSRIFSSLTFPQNFLGSDHCRRNRLLWHPASETHSTSSLRDVGRRRARSSCAALHLHGVFSRASMVSRTTKWKI